MKWSLFALLVGFVIDLIVGDPHSIPHPVIGIGNFVSLVLGLVIAGMLAFQFPLIVFALLTLGIVSLETMRKMRRIIIVIILIAAGILTPPDIASQILMALPCYLLFEAALLIYSILYQTVPPASFASSTITTRSSFLS